MTPAINLLKKHGIVHSVLSYPHDPDAASYGGEAVQQLGLDPAQVFKTLLASTETHELLVAIVPVAILIALFQERVVGGLTQGGLKG